MTPPDPLPPDYPNRPGVCLEFRFEYALPCPTPDDSVLADSTVQHRLNEEWAQSALELKERGGWIYRNTTTGEYLVQHDANTDATRNRCSVNFSPIPQPPPGYEGVRIWHTHIIPPGMPRQFLIGDCPNLPPKFISGDGLGREGSLGKDGVSPEAAYCH